ncbi:MAG: hypothetical protein WCY78_03660 [Sphaerochaetaceae bacterium]
MVKISKMALLILFSLSLFGCTTERLVIDEAMAQHLQEVVNEELVDYRLPLRGNNPANLNNGGYILGDEDNLYFVRKMVFDADSEVNYLQRLHKNLIGKISPSDELLFATNGTLLALWEGQLIVLENKKLLALNLEDYEESELSVEAVTRAHFYAGELFFSTEKGDLFSLSQGLLLKESGELIGLDDNYFYLLNNGKLEFIARESLKSVKTLAGGTYEKATIGSNGLFFLSDGCLKRQSFDSGTIKSIICGVREYVTEGYTLVTARDDHGLYLSELDGSNTRLISEDQASGLQLLDNRLVYRNGFDGGELYTIDLIPNYRCALSGPTLTDGGLQFLPFDKEENDQILEIYEPFLKEVANRRISLEQCELPYKGKVIFVENGRNFYHRKGEEITLSDLFYIAVISTVPVSLGKYSDNSIAYRVDTIITLYVPYDPNPLLSCTILGNAPSPIKSGEGDRWGLPSSWHERALKLIDYIND